MINLHRNNEAGRDQKRYLQSCDLVNGSLYGKKGVTHNVNLASQSNTAPEKEDIMSAYNRFYKRQYVAMEKIFRKDK